MQGGFYPSWNKSKHSFAYQGMNPKNKCEKFSFVLLLPNALYFQRCAIAQ